MTHNSRETKYWRVNKDKVPGYIEEIENIPTVVHPTGTSKNCFRNSVSSRKRSSLTSYISATTPSATGRRRIRRRHSTKIAKVLFIKVYVERVLTRRRRKNPFSVEVLREQFGPDPINSLFQVTKQDYEADKIFDDDERINLKLATGEEICTQTGEVQPF